MGRAAAQPPPQVTLAKMASGPSGGRELALLPSGAATAGGSPSADFAGLGASRDRPIPGTMQLAQEEWMRSRPDCGFSVFHAILKTPWVQGHAMSFNNYNLNNQITRILF